MEDFSKYLELINNCNPDDPLLTTTTLAHQLKQIPLDHVNPADLINLIQALNIEQLITTEDGLARDYRGLAEVMGFKSIEIEKFKRHYNPTKGLIDSLINKNLDSGGNCQLSLNDLIKMVEKIERFDVIDDILPVLVKLANNNQQVMKQSNSHDLKIIKYSNKAQNLVKDIDQLTIDDTPQSTILYDAFICYAPEDIHYAQELIFLLEEHNARIATADDLLPGHFEHDALVRLIDMRCKKVIVLLTPNFSQSKECELQTKFASEFAIRDCSPKIIPVLYESCDDSTLPSMIKVLSKIDMTDHRSRCWQVKRLLHSLGLNNDLRIRGTATHRQTRSDFSSNTSPTNNSPDLVNSTAQISRNDINNGPIIDLLQSQNSSAISENIKSICSNDNESYDLTERKHSPIRSSKLSQTIRWMGRVLGNASSMESISPSTSSQRMLISQESNDYPNDTLSNIDNKP